MNRFSLKLSRRHFLALIGAVVLVISSSIGFIPTALAQSAPSSQMLASLFSFSGTRPNNLGIEEGQLADCPESPNCVSSQSADVVHKIDPFTYETSATEAFDSLKTIINSMDNAKIIREDEDYLYAEFTSAIMGFVDDVEFYLDEADRIIHVRSASRLGESDLGVNRKRVETIRSIFES